MITGITGQDGAFLSKLLIDKGYRVCGIVSKLKRTRLKNLEYLGIVDHIELNKINLLNRNEIDHFISQIKPDEIYNLAAQSSVAVSFQNPYDTFDFNIRSSMNLLDAVRTVSPSTRFYQASSSEMYGKVASLPVTETSVLHPVSPYGISKAAGHWMAINHREAYGIFSCSGILFNHESVFRPDTFVTKKIIATAVDIKKGKKKKLELGNIDIRRDFGYAPEYVKSMWLMLQQDAAGEYVIATNEAHSIREFVKLTFNCLGLDWEEHTVIDRNLFRHSDIDIIYGNPAKARRKLRWDYQIGFNRLIEMLVEDHLRFYGCQRTPA